MDELEVEHEACEMMRPAVQLATSVLPRGGRLVCLLPSFPGEGVRPSWVQALSTGSGGFRLRACCEQALGADGARGGKAAMRRWAVCMERQC